MESKGKSELIFLKKFEDINFVIGKEKYNKENINVEIGVNSLVICVFNFIQIFIILFNENKESINILVKVDF